MAVKIKIKDLSLMDDILFKEAFAHPDNRKVLEDLLEVLLDYEEGFLHNKLKVEYESILEKDTYYDKNMTSDIVVNYDKVIINLEAYTYFSKESVIKSVCYIMRVFSKINRGEKYSKNDKVIQINLVDDEYSNINNEIEDDYQIINKRKIEDTLLDSFEIKIIRIDKARTLKYNESDRKIRWIKFIGAKSKEERDYYAKGDEILMKFSKWVDKYVMDHKTREEFHDWSVRLKQEEFKHNGRMEGIEIGIVEANYQNAIKMLNKNLDTELISECTGLSKREIETLKEKNCH